MQLNKNRTSTTDQENQVENQIYGTEGLEEDEEANRIIIVDRRVPAQVKMIEIMRAAGVPLKTCHNRNSIDAAIDTYMQARRAFKVFMVNLEQMMEHYSKKRPLSDFKQTITAAAREAYADTNAPKLVFVLISASPPSEIQAQFKESQFDECLGYPLQPIMLQKIAEKYKLLNVRKKRGKHSELPVDSDKRV